MREKQVLSDWEITIDKLNYKAKVKAPHTWNVCDETQNHRGKAKYTTTAFIDKKLKGKNVILRFGAVFNTASVKVNGKYIGAHLGSGYTPFSFDITDVVKFGTENRIEVTVRNQRSRRMLPYLRHFDWANDGGLIREVSLLFTEPNSIKNMLITTQLTAIGDSLCSGCLDLNISFYDNHKSDNAKFVVTEFLSNETVLSCEKQISNNCVTLQFNDLKLWDFDNPNLYYLTVIINDNSFTQRFGLRKIEATENHILLNNKPVYLTGCEWMPGAHPDYGMAEPIEHSIKCLKQLKDSNCRFTRFHWQQDSNLYDWCDENGLLVQEEIPYWGTPQRATARQLKIAKMQADEMLEAHFNHPSIIFWGAGNELGGFYKSTQKYVKKMVAYFKSKDKTRCVNYVSCTLGKKPQKGDATLFGDVAMWNEYLGLWEPCDDFNKKMLQINQICENKPLVISEFGLCEPFFSGGDERRIQVLFDNIELFQIANKIQGYVWFSLNDYRTQIGEEGEGRFKQRVHGSTDLYGNKKPSYDALCQANARQIEMHNKESIGVYTQKTGKIACNTQKNASK